MDKESLEGLDGAMWMRILERSADEDVQEPQEGEAIGHGEA